MTAVKDVKDVFSKRQHPVKILSYTTRNFWLLLIPLTRSLVALRFDIAAWLHGAWLDILILSLIFAFAFFRWFFTSFEIREDEILRRSGIFVTVTDRVFFSQTATVSISQSIFNRLCHSYQVYIDTNSGTAANADIRLLLRKKYAQRLMEMQNKSSKSNVRYTFSPRKLHLVLFSLIFSSTLTGVVLFATVTYQASRIIGREFERRLLYGFNELTRILAYGVPPVMVGIIFVIIGGWLVSFIANLTRHWSLAVTRRGDKMIIRSGLATKRSHIISSDKINYTDIRQNLLMKIFRVSSVHIHCAGYGKGRREIAVLLPITTRHEVFDSLHMLMPKLPSVNIRVKPRLKNIMRFLWIPLIATAALPVAIYVLTRLLPNWSAMIVNVGILFFAPCVWLLIVKVFAFFSTGIGENNGYMTFKYCRFYQFHSIIVPKEKICKIRVYQTVFQRFGTSCNIELYTHSESRKSHKIKNIPKEKAEEIKKSIDCED